MNTPDHRTVPGYPGLYVLGCWERNVSIYLQQVRALNLAWAFDLPPDAQVAVLGGGFAGLTAAAGLAKRGYRTHLFEKGPCLLQGQRQNRTRWVHPHLHEWPRPGSDNPLAGLPLLDWTAGLAADMAAHILQQFERCGVVTTCDAKATRLEPQGARWRVGDHGEFDAVVLALGLGVEKSFADLPLNAYWMDDTIATEGPFRRFFVSGIGEGGVIDTLYLRLRHFNHADIVRSCLAGFQPLKDRLVALEGASHLADRYAELDVPGSIDDHLRQRLRIDTQVTLNGGTADYLSPKADILNRFLLSRLVCLGAIEYAPGRLTEIQAGVDGFHIRLDGGPQQAFDRVLIRHGTVPALQHQYPEIWKAWVGNRTTPDPTEVFPAWRDL